MKVTLAVDAERIVLASPDGYTMNGNVITLTEKTLEQIREWKGQGKKVDALIEYSSDYLYCSMVEDQTRAWYRPQWEASE